MLACDLRIAAENATFGLTETRWGIIPAADGTQRLQRTVSMAKAMEIMLMAEQMSAAEAYRIGLINKVVPQAELMNEVERWVATLLERGPLALRAAKQAVLQGLSLPLAVRNATGTTSLQRSVSLLPQPVKEPAISYWPAPETAQAEELIGSMYLLIHETKGKIHRVGPQDTEEQFADRDAPTNAQVVGSLAVQLREHSFGSPISPLVHRDQVWFGSARE